MHDVIPSKTGQVFGDDHIDLAGFDVLDHSLKVRTVEAGPAETIINIGIENGQPVLLNKFIQQGLLVGNTLGGAFTFILL